MSKRKVRSYLRPVNPYVPHLRAKTVQSKKRVASKRACRGRVEVERG